MNNYSMISFEKKFTFQGGYLTCISGVNVYIQRTVKVQPQKAIPRPITDEPLFVLMNI